MEIHSQAFNYLKCLAQRSAHLAITFKAVECSDLRQPHLVLLVVLQVNLFNYNLEVNKDG